MTTTTIKVNKDINHIYVQLMETDVGTIFCYRRWLDKNLCKSYEWKKIADNWFLVLESEEDATAFKLRFGNNG